MNKELRVRRYRMIVKTKEDALLHCFDLWLWMACNPERLKEDWPGWIRNGGYLGRCMSHCPCCEYKENNNDENMSCENICPLTWTVGGDWCGNDYSPYGKWNSTIRLSLKTKYALEICALAIDAM